MKNRMFTKKELFGIVTTCILVTTAISTTIFNHLDNKKQQKLRDELYVEKMRTKDNPNPVDSISHKGNQTLFYKNGRVISSYIVK